MLIAMVCSVKIDIIGRSSKGVKKNNLPVCLAGMGGKTGDLQLP